MYFLWLNEGNNFFFHLLKFFVSISSLRSLRECFKWIYFGKMFSSKIELYNPWFSIHHHQPYPDDLFSHVFLFNVIPFTFESFFFFLLLYTVFSICQLMNAYFSLSLGWTTVQNDCCMYIFIVFFFRKVIVSLHHFIVPFWSISFARSLSVFLSLLHTNCLYISNVE